MWGATPSKSGATGGSRRGDSIWGLAGYRAGREVVVDWIGLTRNSLSLSRLRTRDGRCGLPAILAGSLNILRQTGGGEQARALESLPHRPIEEAGKIRQDADTAANATVPGGGRRPGRLGKMHAGSGFAQTASAILPVPLFAARGCGMSVWPPRAEYRGLARGQR